jgi:Trp operon repressor
VWSFGDVSPSVRLQIPTEDFAFFCPHIACFLTAENIPDLTTPTFVTSTLLTTVDKRREIASIAGRGYNIVTNGINTIASAAVASRKIR